MAGQGLVCEVVSDGVFFQDLYHLRVLASLLCFSLVVGSSEVSCRITIRIRWWCSFVRFGVSMLVWTSFGGWSSVLRVFFLGWFA